MITLQKGQKMKFNDLTTDGRLTVTVNTQMKNGEADVTCFGVDGAGKLSDDRYFVFYNQLQSPEGAIKMQTAAETTTFTIDLNRLPAGIQKLVLTMAVDNGAMNQLNNGNLRFRGDTNEGSYTFLGSDFTNEKAVILAEIYQKDNLWRLSVVASGFNGGLSALLAFFGGEEIAPSAPEPPKQPEPPKGPISLKKTGDTHKISLSKNNQQIHVNLNWNNEAKKSGFFGLKTAAIDLDLACMYRLKTGEQGVIQALGQSFGAKDRPPYIYLDKDDRTGSSNDGENMYFTKPEAIEFAIVFAYIYEGAPNWQNTDAIVVLQQQNEPDIRIAIDNSNSQQRFCVIASLSASGSELTVKREELYFAGHREVDQHYGFGFRWQAGRK